LGTGGIGCSEAGRIAAWWSFDEERTNLPAATIIAGEPGYSNSRGLAIHE
jgi:hypothetical protein